MNISKPLRRVILLELSIPLALLSIGIFEGLAQVIYRSGMIHQASFAGTDYYQGLTLHGVINAIVLTTFFAVAFGHATIAYFLKREPSAKLAMLSFVIMLTGTLLAAYAMLSGKASVLYTFYPPLKAHVTFYLGAALIIVGSWIPFFDWVSIYIKWRKENKDVKMPIGVLGTLVNFTVWFVCSLSVAYEVIILLIPWSVGFTETVNVTFARTLFWFFGHALVYFWLLPSYIMFYTFLPKIAGGKLYSDNAGRIVFLMFLLLSIPVGVHHQFSDPNISRGVKWVHSMLTFGIVIPSFITAFTLAASLEYAGRKRGAKGLLNWLTHLPYFQKDNFLFGYLICGLILFIFGGLTGIVNASYSLNNMVHNTAYQPGHFHMTVAGPVFLAILGMSMYLIKELTGKKIQLPVFNTMVPYLWVIGLLTFSTGLIWGGLIGEPRRTNLGMTYLNPESNLYHHQWVNDTTITLFGGIIMFIAGVMFLSSFFMTLFSKKISESKLDFPVSESLHVEKRIGIIDRFGPWLIVMFVLILLAYVPALMDVFKYSGPGSPAFLPDNPIPLK